MAYTPFNPYQPYIQSQFTPYSPQFTPPPVTQVQMQQSPAQQQTVQQQTVQQQPVQQSMSWVNGEQDVQNFIVLPGNSALLMSRNESVFWLKSTDQSGMPLPLRIFDYTERTSEQQIPVQMNTSDYVTREEFNALAARLNELTTTKENSNVQSTV